MTLLAKALIIAGLTYTDASKIRFEFSRCTKSVQTVLLWIGALSRLEQTVITAHIWSILYIDCNRSRCIVKVGEAVHERRLEG